MKWKRFTLQSPEVGADGAGAPVVEKSTSTALDAAELAELRAMKGDYEKLKGQLDADKKKAKDAAAASAKDAETKGELAKALEAHKARVAELEGAEDDAKAWREHQAAELRRVEERKAALPEAVQKALDACPTLAAKQAVLAAFDVAGTSTSKPNNKPTGSAGAGAPNTKVDFGTISDQATLRTAKAADPAGWEAYKAALSGQDQRPKTSFELRRAAQQKKG